MTYHIYDTLPEEAVWIRNLAFVEEQGFVDEFDDEDIKAHHIILFSEEKPIACVRYFYSQKQESYVIGRLAVLKEFRGKKVGALALSLAEEEIKKLGGKEARLAAQVRAKPFYEKQGYLAYGEEFLEEYCPHIWMKKTL